MNNKILLLGVLSVALMVFLAGCAKTSTTAPTVSSENVESSSSSTETVAGSFVDDATPTADQIVPDLT